MPEWKVISYNGKEIKTKEDILWACEEVVKAYKSDNVELKDMMLLSYLKELHSDHIGPVKNRWELLDL